MLKRENAAIQDRLSDSTAYNWTARLYKACRIRSSKKTHAGRVSGVRVAEENGVSEDQVYEFLFSPPPLFFPIINYRCYRFAAAAVGMQIR